MKKVQHTIMCGVAALALAGTAATSAFAATGWEHSDFRGNAIGGDTMPNLGNMNDRISSWRKY
ncbi:MAG: hypothetical protein Q4G34_06995 [Micrococcus sp.]|nr:hypothetical protein [Micrococcus sp.]